jgi:hypothetical protein
VRINYNQLKALQVSRETKMQINLPSNGFYMPDYDAEKGKFPKF